MAVTSIWPIKGRIDKVINYARNPEKTTEGGLEKQAALHAVDDVIEYAADDMKTEKRCFVTCINCKEDDAARQFKETKEFWSRVSGKDKTGGRVCFHGYQSFAAGEVTAEQAHAIGVELAKRLWGNEFEVVVATHCNTGHYHNHLVINSVSQLDGHKFDNRRTDYLAMKNISDQLCLEHGLSVIEDPVSRGKNYAEYLAEKNGKPTNRSLIRDDIDRGIKACLTIPEFFDYMKSLGYEFKLRGEGGTLLKRPAIKPPGAQHFFRFYKLGEGYDLPEIEERVADNYRRRLPFPDTEKEAVREYRKMHEPRPKAQGIHALYIRYCFELHILNKYPTSVKRVSAFLREDLAKLDRLDEQTRFLAVNGIETLEDLRKNRAAAEKSLPGLQSKRNNLRNELKRVIRAGDGDGEARVTQEISDTTAAINEMRKRIRLCNLIEERSKPMTEALNALQEEQIKEEKEEKAHEQLFGRSGRTGREDDIRRR